MSRDRRRFGGLLYVIVAPALVATVAACVAFAHREQLLVRYYAESFLATSAPSDRIRSWLVNRPHLSLPILVAKLQSPTNAVCERSGSLLLEVLQRTKDPTDPQDSHLSLSLGSMVNAGYPSFSVDGRIQAAHIALGVLRVHLSGWSPDIPTALATSGQTLVMALSDPNARVQLAALERLPATWAWDGGDSVVNSLVATWKWRCYQRAVALFASPRSDVRAAAAMAIRGASSHDGDVALIQLLDDSEVVVRKAALRSILGYAVDSLTGENRARLVDLLADPDAEVRDLAQRVLLASGLSPDHLRLAVLLRSDDPAERATIPHLVLEIAGIDAKRWIHELVKDEAAVVREAAVQAASKLKDAQFDDIFKQLSKDDPDPSVRKACELSLQERLAQPKK